MLPYYFTEVVVAFDKDEGNWVEGLGDVAFDNNYNSIEVAEDMGKEGTDTQLGQDSYDDELIHYFFFPSSVKKFNFVLIFIKVVSTVTVSFFSVSFHNLLLFTFINVICLCVDFSSIY